MNLFIDNINFTSKVLYMPKTQAQIEGEVAHLVTAVSKGLKGLVNYSKNYAIHKHEQKY